MSDCSNHKRTLYGIGNMRAVAECIGDLHYETLAELFDHLYEKLRKDALNDLDGGREKLYSQISDAALAIHSAKYHIEQAWQISKPHMDNHQ